MKNRLTFWRVLLALVIISSLPIGEGWGGVCFAQGGDLSSGEPPRTIVSIVAPLSGKGTTTSPLMLNVPAFGNILKSNGVGWGYTTDNDNQTLSYVYPNLSISGGNSFSFAPVTVVVTANYIIPINVDVVVVNNLAATVNITFPVAGTAPPSRRIVVKRQDNTSTGTINLVGNSGTTGIENSAGTFASSVPLGTTATTRRYQFQAISGKWHLLIN